MHLEDATGPTLQSSEEEGRVLLLEKEGLASPMDWDVACPIHRPRKQILICRHCRSEPFVYMQSIVHAPRAESLSVTFSLFLLQ